MCVCVDDCFLVLRDTGQAVRPFKSGDKHAMFPFAYLMTDGNGMQNSQDER